MYMCYYVTASTVRFPTCRLCLTYWPENVLSASEGATDQQCVFVYAVAKRLHNSNFQNCSILGFPAASHPSANHSSDCSCITLIQSRYSDHPAYKCQMLQLWRKASTFCRPPCLCCSRPLPSSPCCPSAQQRQRQTTALSWSSLWQQQSSIRYRSVHHPNSTLCLTPSV